GDRSATSGQEPRGGEPPLRRREGPDRGVAHLRHLPDQADPLLPPRRSGRPAQRSERRPVQRDGPRDEPQLAVHRDHAQQAHDGSGGLALRRDHGGAGHLEDRLGQALPTSRHRRRVATTRSTGPSLVGFWRASFRVSGVTPRTLSLAEKYTVTSPHSAKESRWPTAVSAGAADTPARRRRHASET